MKTYIATHYPNVLKGVLFLLIVTTLGSCERQELDPTFKGEATLNITSDRTQGAVGDSVEYTFAVQSGNPTEAQIMMHAISIGNLSPVDRTVRLEIDPALTTALPSEYELPSNLTIPANQFRTPFFIKVKRAARLKTENARLRVRVVTNENFTPGTFTRGIPTQIGNLSYANPNQAPSFLIKFTDQLVIPSTWATLYVYYVGKWSKVKHQLMIDASGITNIAAVPTNDYPTIFYIQARTQNALNEYNIAHPGNPLKSEFGEVINICSGCN